MAPGPARKASAPGAARLAAARPADSSRWRDLAPRVASAMALGPIALGAAWEGGWMWEALLTLLATIAVVEWASLCGLKLDGWRAQAAVAAIPAAQAAYIATGLVSAPVAVIVLASVGMTIVHRLLGAGVLYVGAGYLGLLMLRVAAPGPFDLFFVLLVVWANDIGAYLAGRLIGGRRMAPRLSPGKTWSGAGGGVVFAIAAGLCVAIWSGAGNAGQYRAEGLAIALSVLAQVGDLMESALKRRTGRKDSGHLIPGHGGLLDRVDGLLAAAIGAWVWQLAWHGRYLWQ